MYVESVPNRNSPPAVLLRESFRVGSKVRKRTILNLSKWPPHPASYPQVSSGIIRWYSLLS